MLEKSFGAHGGPCLDLSFFCLHGSDVFPEEPFEERNLLRHPLSGSRRCGMVFGGPAPRGAGGKFRVFDIHLFRDGRKSGNEPRSPRREGEANPDGPGLDAARTQTLEGHPSGAALDTWFLADSGSSICGLHIRARSTKDIPWTPGKGLLAGSLAFAIEEQLVETRSLGDGMVCAALCPY